MAHGHCHYVNARKDMLSIADKISKHIEEFKLRKKIQNNKKSIFTKYKSIAIIDKSIITKGGK